MGDELENPCKSWLLDSPWSLIGRLSQFDAFAKLPDSFRTMGEDWKALCDSSEPYNMPFPGTFDDMSSFQKLAILRCLRSDKFVPAARNFVTEHIGKRFVEAPPFDLEGSYNDSACNRPIVFVLSPGSDPMASLRKFAGDLGKADKIKLISLGQGQGDIAKVMIAKGLRDGDWVILQNCHLAVSWMPALEKITAAINPATSNPDFRLWMTSYPSPSFPVAILQDGVKITTEPPKGLKNNLQSSFMSDLISAPDFWEGCAKEKHLKTMTFALCFFHANILERREYGPLGWNIRYEFNESDQRISARQLKMFMTDSGSDGPIPYKALCYLTGECNYGGRVTDDWDRRTLMSILRKYYQEDIHKPNFGLSESGAYVVPPAGPMQSYLDFVKTMPVNTKPEVFGMHENANISKEQNETSLMLASILLTEGKGSAGGASSERDAMLDEVASGVLTKLPKKSDP